MKLEFNGYIRNTDANYIYKIDLEKIVSNQVSKMKELGRTTKRVKIIIEEPILDDTERKYLSGVIRPFRDGINFIGKKDCSNESEYLWFNMKNEPDWTMPLFKKGSVYKGMELNKEYSLDDLNL